MCQSNTQPVLTIVRVYLKNGRSQTLPYRTAARADCRSCEAHAETRFLGWLRRMNSAQPGFATMIRSVYVRVYGPACPACQARLVQVLGRYKLADRLRYVARPGTYSVRTCQCGKCAASGPNSETGAEVTGELSPSQKSQARGAARQQADSLGLKRTNHRQVDHGIPLAQAHLDKATSANANARNLRLVTLRVHQEKERLWNAYVQSTFYQRCSTPEQRKRKLAEIFTALRKKYPNDTVSRAFGQELELLELEIF